MADAKKAKKEENKASAKGPELKAVEKDPLAGEDGSGDTPPVEGGGARFSNKKALFIVLFCLFMLLGSGTGAYFLYFSKHEDKIDCTTVTEGDKDYAACAQEMSKSGAPPPPGVFVDIPEMIVNLNSTSKQPRFLKVSLKVELEAKEDQKGFEAILPRVVDQFQTYLRELRLEDLRGSSGMYRMKIELLSRVRAAAPDIKVRDVLFQGILVQ